MFLYVYRNMSDIKESVCEEKKEKIKKNNTLTQIYMKNCSYIPLLPSHSSPVLFCPSTFELI